MKLIKVKRDNIAIVQGADGHSPMVHSKSEVLESYKDVFKGLGKMPGKVHLKTDSSVDPVNMPPRCVPIAVKEKLKHELDRLEYMDVIAKVTEPTEWVSSLVVVQKPSGKSGFALTYST